MGNLTSRLRKTPGTSKSSSPPESKLIQRPQRGAPDEQETKPIFLIPSQITLKPPESFHEPGRGHITWRTLLSSGLTPSNTLTAGIATCPAKTGYLGHHRHEQAEIYLILEGEGLMYVDGAEQRVEKGGVVFIPGNAEHGIRNVGEEDLVWFYCFAADRFEDVVYRFEGGEMARLEP